MRSYLLQRRTLAAWFVFLLTMSTAAITAEDDSYRYRLEEGKEHKVCQHMQSVYNKHFRRPWDFRDLPIRTPPFPRLPGVEYDERKALDLSFSAFPSSPEFDAVPWMEGRATRRVSPTLVTQLDIDNDGKPETLIKTSFMLGYSPAHNSAPGGEDEIWIVDKEQVNLSEPLAIFDLHKSVGQQRPARLGMDTFAMPVRSIRPFLFDDVTYLSMYEQEVSSEGKRWRTRETMWVMKYRQGGWHKGGGNWEPVKAARICRFRMVPVKENG
jgi:hypothetical protein